MSYQNPKIAQAADALRQSLEALDDKAAILKAPELKALYAELPKLPLEEKAEFGREVNALKKELADLARESRVKSQESRPSVDITAPFDVNTPADKRPRTLRAEHGSRHPLMTELDQVLDIFYRMGFTAVESRQLDDDWHMFTSLNFPEDHPARDDYDTFSTVEAGQNGKPLVAPAHTSTMQNRVLQQYKGNLEEGKPIAVVIPGRVFRNEDLDARHEHTFYQLEGVYVGKGVHAGQLIATLKTFMQEYYQRDLKIKTQPFYFPFTEPSFEFVAECIFCGQQGCNICSQTGWIELLGCGMIHPNVLKMAGIDPAVYTGFAWGGGIERPVMLKYNIEDIRHFHSGKLDFLKQFA